MRTMAYIVGDIHGCFAELLELEAHLMQHAAKHGRQALVVSCGDLVDRGPDSGAVVRRFRQGVAAGTHAAILGNHEVMCLQSLECAHPDMLDGQTGVALPRGIGSHAGIFMQQKSNFTRSLCWEEYAIMQRGLWLGQGGAETLLSFGVDPRQPSSWRHVDMEDVAFLATLPTVWEDDHVVVTHALIAAEQLQTLRAARLGIMVDDQAYERALWAALTNRKMPAACPDEERVHISGHTPVDRVKRRRKLGLAQIDTGCCYGRSLTAYCTETEETFAVSLQAEPGSG